MTVLASHLAVDNLLRLPAREAPYFLQEVYESVKDECRSEIVLQWSEGYLLFRADEESLHLVRKGFKERVIRASDAKKRTSTPIWPLGSRL